MQQEDTTQPETETVNQTKEEQEANKDQSLPATNEHEETENVEPSTKAEDPEPTPNPEDPITNAPEPPENITPQPQELKPDEQTEEQLKPPSTNTSVEKKPRKGSKEQSKEREETDKDDKKKTKASSTTKDKLKYLEEKYKELYKENNARKEDVKELVHILSKALKDIGGKLPSGEYKTGDAQKYKQVYLDAWFLYSKKLEDQKNEASTEFAAQQKQLKDKMDDLEQKSKKGQEEAVKEAKQAYEKNIKNLEEMGSKLQKDNANLLSMLKMKETEISQLRQMNLDLSNKATDSLLDRFDKIEENTFSNKLQQSSRVDELIRLRNNLDEAYLEIDTLKQKLAGGVEPEIMEGEKTPLSSGKEKNHQQTQTQPIVLLPSQSSHSIGGSPSPRPSQLEEALEKAMLESKTKDESEGKQNEYLKNLIIRYMVFEAKKNEAECSVLRRAILDYIKVDSSERGMIDDAVNNRGGIKDSIYFLRFLGGGK